MVTQRKAHLKLVKEREDLPNEQAQDQSAPSEQVLPPATTLSHGWYDQEFPRDEKTPELGNVRGHREKTEQPAEGGEDDVDEALANKKNATR